MRQTARLPILLALFCAAFLFCVVQPLAGQVCVEIEPAHAYAMKGDTVTLTVRVRDVADLRGASVNLAFQKSILRYLNAIQGDFLSKNPDGFDVAFFVTERPLGSPDSVLVDQAIMGLSAVEGSGVLFTVRFFAEQGGNADVAIWGVDLRSKENAAIPASGTGASVTVNNGSNHPPTKPILLAPANITQLATFADTLRWSSSSDPDQDTLSYALRLSGPGLDTLYTALTDTVFVLHEQRLRPDTTYFWYVEARDRFSVSRSDQTFRFITPKATALEIPGAPPACILLSVSPNPARGSIRISYRVSRPTCVHFSLADGLGRQVGAATVSDDDAGLHLRSMTLPRLAAGVYYLAFRAERSVFTRRIVVFQ